MGGAAGCAHLLSLDPSQCSHALAIAASLAGAPMANAATQSKPLHIGNASRLGMEAALLASSGLEASPLILDFVPDVAGFNAFYEDYAPQPLNLVKDEGHSFLIEEQDNCVSNASLPTWGMHWVVDAAASVHELLAGSASRVQEIVLRVPPLQVHQPALPGERAPGTPFLPVQRLQCPLGRGGDGAVLRRRRRHAPGAGDAAEPGPRGAPGRQPRLTLNLMYAEVHVTLEGGDVLSGRCDTFYGHWRNPLTTESLREKFRSNAGAVLPREKVEGLIDAVEALEELQDCTPLLSRLQ